MAVVEVGSTSGNAFAFLGFRDFPFHTLIQQVQDQGQTFSFLHN